MAPKKYHVTETELLVMSVLWDRTQASTREICDQLYPDGDESSYYTVQKLLERLEQRGCVHRDRSNRIHLFSAAIDKTALIAARLRELSDSLCDGKLHPMLTGLIKLNRWTAKEQKQLNDLVANLDQKKKGN